MTIHTKALRDALVRAEQKLLAYVGVCKGDKELTGAVLPMVRAALAATEGDGWLPIENAPKNRSVLLYQKNLPIYCGKKRYGNLGEPQQDIIAWRCDSSGRFANPTHWKPLPPAPKEPT